MTTLQTLFKKYNKCPMCGSANIEFQENDSYERKEVNDLSADDRFCPLGRSVVVTCRSTSSCGKELYREDRIYTKDERELLMSNMLARTPKDSSETP